jgi:hypothetical protein
MSCSTESGDRIASVDALFHIARPITPDAVVAARPLR